MVHRDLHRCLGAVRDRDQRVAAGVLPGAPRLRRRRAPADRAGDLVRNVSAQPARGGHGVLRDRRDGRSGAGPIIGGYIVDNATWPLIYFINLPIGIVAFLMTLANVPDAQHLEKPKTGLDVFGLALLTIGLGSLQYVLERGQHDDWWSSGAIVALTCVSAIALPWFLVRMLRARYPLVDLRAFRFRGFWVGNVLLCVVGFGLFGTSLIMPLFFQTIWG